MSAMANPVSEKDLFEIIRRQSEQIDQLIAENTALKAENVRLKTRIEELERRVDEQMRTFMQQMDAKVESRMTDLEREI